MSRRHIVLARARVDLPFSFRRADYVGENWHLAVGVSDSLRALVDGVLSTALANDLTISPRAVDDFLVAPPEKISVPSGLTAAILMPINEPTAPHTADVWMRVVSVPAAGFFEVVEKSEFAVQTLGTQLREMLSEAEIKSFASPIHRSEIWVRPGWSAAALFPSISARHKPKSGLPPARPDGRTREEVVAQNRRNAMAKKASHGYENARIFNEAEGKKHAKAVVAEIQAARAKKK